MPESIMYRQYSSRNQRNKGMKVKHALRICVFLAVCFWLIYQVKHSHDKKKEFEESDVDDPLDRGSIGGLIKIGRKEIRPLYQEVVTVNEQHNQAAEEEETTEVENNHEDKKVELDNEASRDGDDETDEHEIQKSEASRDREVDQEEDNITDEVGEDGIDSETGEISDDGNGRKQENFVENGGHDGDDENHEAREELYKADDASSAVSHDNHTQTTENESKFVRISGDPHENMFELENNENHGEKANKGQIKERLEVDSGEESEDTNRSSATDIATNVLAIEAKVNNLESSEKNPSPNSTLTEAFNDHLAASNGTIDVTTQNPRLSEQNVPELDHGQGIVTEDTSAEGSNFETIALEQANNSTIDVENHLSYSNSTDHTESINSESNLEDFSIPSNDTDSFSDTDSFTVVRITRSEHALEDGANAQKNEIVSANSVSSNGTDGNENPKEVHIDSTDFSGSANS